MLRRARAGATPAPGEVPRARDLRRVQALRLDLGSVSVHSSGVSGLGRETQGLGSKSRIDGTSEPSPTPLCAPASGGKRPQARLRGALRTKPLGPQQGLGL